jgi:hypothetical protein
MRCSSKVPLSQEAYSLLLPPSGFSVIFLFVFIFSLSLRRGTLQIIYRPVLAYQHRSCLVFFFSSCACLWHCKPCCPCLLDQGLGKSGLKKHVHQQICSQPCSLCQNPWDPLSPAHLPAKAKHAPVRFLFSRRHPPAPPSSPAIGSTSCIVGRPCRRCPALTTRDTSPRLGPT